MEYSHCTYDHFFTTYPVLITKVQRDVESKDTPTDLAQDREFSEMVLAQATFILNLVFMTIFSKNLQRFEVLFHGMLQFKKLKLNLSNARDESKTGPKK